MTQPRIRRAALGLVTVVATAPVVAVLSGASPAAAASACGTSYSYASLHKTDPNGFFAPDMRSYVAECVNRVGGGDLAKTERGRNGKTGTFGEPGTWDATAKALGFPVSTSPAVGRVLVVHSGENAVEVDAKGATIGTVGGPFVAYVDAVYSDSSVLMRTYDTGAKKVVSFRVKGPRYATLTGGVGIRAGQPTATATPSASVTPTPTPTPSVSASPTPSSTPTAGPTPVATTEEPVPTLPPSESQVPVASSKHDSTRTIVLAGAAGLAIAVVAGLAGVALGRRGVSEFD